ncbi:MAG: hypothetical protein AAF527_06085, partial [Pseudomonadota bacterium]
PRKLNGAIMTHIQDASFTEVRDDEGCERLRAVIERAGKEPLEGYLFVRPGQRPSDVLNDRRDFLPVAALDGRFMLVAKSAITEIEPKEDGACEEEDTGADPYEVMGVGEDASMPDVVTVYKNRLKRMHPDAVRAAGLDRELVEAADILTKQLNDAYQAIRRRHVRDDYLRPRR